jgi:hypothetical protein
MKKIILTEADKKQIILAKEKAILESFANTFNKIKRTDESELNEYDLETIKKQLADTGYPADDEELSNIQGAINMGKNKPTNENELTQNNDRETIVTLLKNEDFVYSTEDVDIISLDNGLNSKLKITFEGYEYDEEEWPGHSNHYELNVTFNFYYKISGEYRRATWGYDGGSPEEYPEVEFYLKSIEEAFYGINDGESILEITEDLKDMLFAEIKRKIDMEKLDKYIYDYINSNDDGGY